VLRDPNRERTTLGSNVLWQVALLELWLQAMEQLRPFVWAAEVVAGHSPPR
jgi:hypothetical protein